MQLENAKVLVTGASAGIGAEFARQFHARGADLVLVARREEQLHSLAAGLNAVRPASARYFVVDLAKSEADLAQLLDFVRTNRVDILVNNAGRGSYGFFEERDLETELHMVQLNISATLRLAHGVIPQMKKRRSGAIISLSSIAAFQPLPYMATYAATKAFNFSHSMALRYELKPFGVRVLTVCPGPTDTEFGKIARVPGEIKEIYGDRVEMVVKNSIHALECNSAFVVTGLRSKLMSLASRVLPVRLTSKLMERYLRVNPKSALRV